MNKSCEKSTSKRREIEESICCNAYTLSLSCFHWLIYIRYFSSCSSTCGFSSNTWFFITTSIELQEESQLAKITRDSAKITVEQVHGLMSQVTSHFASWLFTLNREIIYMFLKEHLVFVLNMNFGRRLFVV